MTDLKYDIQKLSSKKINKYINSRLTTCKTSKNPVALIMIGGPGSGKSSTFHKVATILKIPIQTSCILDPDRVFGELFNNNEIYFNEASKINLELLKGAYNNNSNIIYDKTGKNFKKTYKVIQKLNKIGYRVFIAINLVCLPVALNRIKNRDVSSDRRVPLSKVINIYKELAKSIPKYIKLDCNDIAGTFIYDNCNNLVLIYKQMCNSGHIVKWFNESTKINWPEEPLCKTYQLCPKKYKSNQYVSRRTGNEYIQYKVHTGPQGGKYILKGSNKIYVRQ